MQVLWPRTIAGYGQVVTTKAPVVGMSMIIVALLVIIGLSVRTPPPLGFLTRADVPACPQVSIRELSSASGPARALVDGCLFGEQAQRRGAELVVTSTTEEGDDIRTYYRALPPTAGLEVWRDSSGDRYGSSGWEHQVCPEATSIAALGTCRAG